MVERRQRIDSATAGVGVVQATARPLRPPAHAPLHDDAEPFWAEIIGARAAVEWNDHDLTCASDLANAMAQLVENRRAVRDEGEVLTTFDGAPCKPFANPRVAVVHGLTAQIKAARQSLSIHGRAQGEARDVGKRRRIAKDVEDGFEGGDDLLAGPATSLQ